MKKKPLDLFGIEISEADKADYLAFCNRVPEPNRYKEECAVSSWKLVGIQVSASHKNAQGWLPEEKEAVARGKVPCPSCVGTGRYFVIDRGASEETQEVFWKHRVFCSCQEWKHLWKITSGVLGSYDFANLHTLKPTVASRLSESAQQQEIEFLRENSKENFLLLGPPGTSKTTLAYALLREACFRNHRLFWKEGGATPHTVNCCIWRCNFGLLMNEVNAQYSDKAAPEPQVTGAKIELAAKKGHTPVLIVEEVDKTKVSAHNIKYLFNLIDSILGKNGQIIMTSNLTPQEFEASFSTHEDMVSSSESIMRRMYDYGNVRDYFKIKVQEEDKPSVAGKTE